MFQQLDTQSLPTEMLVVEGGENIKIAPSAIANADFWIETLLSSNVEGEPTAMKATFPPGVITNWHAHPCGQLLYVLSGSGHVQKRGRNVVSVRSGDCVWFAPNEEHWHGATDHSVFSYISIQSVANGVVVRWLEPVAGQRESCTGRSGD